MKNKINISELNYLTKIANNQSSMILGDAVLLSKIPSPTFQTHRKAAILLEKFSLLNLDELKIDNFGNVISILSCNKKLPKILVSSNMDTAYDQDVDLNTYIETDKIVGPSIGLNSLGLASLFSLAYILKKNNLFEHGDIIFACTAGSQGSGASAGMRGLMMKYQNTIDYVICLDGIQLGKVANQSLFRNNINIIITTDGVCNSNKLPDTIFKNNNAVYYSTLILNKIFDIDLNMRKEKYITIEKITSEKGNADYANKVKIKLRIEADKLEPVENICSSIDFFAKLISKNNPCKIYLQNNSLTPGGIIGNKEPIIKIISEIHSILNIDTHYVSQVSDVSIPISMNIPAITIGIANGGNKRLLNEYIMPASIKTGFL
ncbi:hypothetical protein KA977_05960 [Candidatus Dependentiae bacterium]|nr:hypothetical protein [Candidatus Dependentiae bacterium]